MKNVQHSCTVYIYSNGLFHLWIHGIISSGIPCSPSPRTLSCSRDRPQEIVQSLHPSPGHYIGHTHAPSASKIISSSLALQFTYSSRYAISYWLTSLLKESFYLELRQLLRVIVSFISWLGLSLARPLPDHELSECWIYFLRGKPFVVDHTYMDGWLQFWQASVHLISTWNQHKTLALAPERTRRVVAQCLRFSRGAAALITADRGNDIQEKRRLKERWQGHLARYHGSKISQLLALRIHPAFSRIDHVRCDRWPLRTMEQKKGISGIILCNMLPLRHLTFETRKECSAAFFATVGHFHWIILHHMKWEAAWTTAIIFLAFWLV